MKSFNWLHLTDLHLGTGTHKPLWPNVRQVFFEDLELLNDRCGPWHAVLFTGDLTQKGISTEFEAVREQVLEPLRSKLRQLGSAAPILLTVPGNHDLQRPDPNKRSAAVRQLLRRDGFAEIRGEFWEDPDSEYRQVVSQAFLNYSAWWNANTPSGLVGLKAGLLPGDFAATLEIGSQPEQLRIGLVGLNTTFLQLADGDFKGRLHCSPSQIHSVCDGDVPKWIQRHDICLLLTHQGPDWLDATSAADDYPEINPAGRFAVHLFGHMHENVVRTLSSGGGEFLRQWQGCSLFGLEKYGEPPAYDRSHGYSSGRIQFFEGEATIRQWPRWAVKDSNGWRFVPDTKSCVLDESDGGTPPQTLPVNPAKETIAFGRASDSRTEIRCSSGGQLVKAGEELQNLDQRWPYDDPALKAYCEAVCSAHRHIRFAEIPSLRDISDSELESLYVEPRLSPQEIDPDAPPSTWPKRADAIPTIRDHPHLVLLGDPGSGKSTLVSCISWHLCRRPSSTPNIWRQAFSGSLPLPMVLRELNLRADLTWEGLLASFLEHRIGKLLPNQKAVRCLLEEGRAIVLLDGLDEIANINIRNKLRDALHAGMIAYPKSRWILTSRIVGYGSAPFHVRIEEVPASRQTDSEILSQGRHLKRVRTHMADLLYLAPFDNAQIHSFSLNWYKQHEKLPELMEISANDFVHAIRENEGTQRLARIPYLLTLMALIHHKNATLPHGRTELYDRIAAAYLESIDMRRRLDNLPYSLTQKKKWLASVAYQMQLRRASKSVSDRNQILASNTQVQRWLRSAMCESRVNHSKEESTTLLDYFARRSGLLLPRGEGKFAFMHLSLQEYFAACFLEPRLTASRFSLTNGNPDPSDEQLRAWANEEVWWETFVLLFELISQKSGPDAEAFLDYLFDGRLYGDSQGKQVAAASLLAELAVDPFVLLGTETRNQIRQDCWRWVFGVDMDKVFASGATRRASAPPAMSGVVRRLVRDAQGNLESAWKTAKLTRQELRRVTHLDLTGCSTLSDLRPLSVLKGLRSLDLSLCPKVSDLKPLAELRDLRALFLDRSTGVGTIEPLRACKRLSFLILGSPQDLSPLSELSELEQVHLHYKHPEQTDLTPVAHLASLKYVCIAPRPGWDINLSAELRLNPDGIRSPGVRKLVETQHSSRTEPLRKRSLPAKPVTPKRGFKGKNQQRSGRNSG